MSNDLDPHELPGKPTKFKKKKFKNRNCQFAPKRRSWIKQRKAIGFLGFYWYEMSLQNQLAVNRCYLLRKGKNDPEGKSESSELIPATMGTG